MIRCSLSVSAIAMSLCAVVLLSGAGTRTAFRGRDYWGRDFGDALRRHVGAQNCRRCPMGSKIMLAANPQSSALVLTVIAFTFAFSRNDIKGYAPGAAFVPGGDRGRWHFTAMAAVIYVRNLLVPVPEAVLQPGACWR